MSDVPLSTTTPPASPEANASKPSTPDVNKQLPDPPQSQLVYSAFPPGRRRLILGIVTAAGFLGPLAGGIYLPVLPELATDFGVSQVVINATVSVFMIVFAVAVSIHLCELNFFLILLLTI